MQGDDVNNSERNMRPDRRGRWRSCAAVGFLLAACWVGLLPGVALAAQAATVQKPAVRAATVEANAPIAAPASSLQAQPAENVLHADAAIEGRAPRAVPAIPAVPANVAPVSAVPASAVPASAVKARPADPGFEPFPRKSPSTPAVTPPPAPSASVSNPNSNPNSTASTPAAAGSDNSAVGATDATPPAAVADAAPANTAPEAALQDVTQQLATLERDLSILEEDLLYPPSSRVAVYLSMDVGDLFALDEVEVKINGTTVVHHLYTEQQVDALHRGGIQRLYVGNARQGDNEITAFFLGRGHQGEALRRATTAKFTKSFEPAYVELKIADSETKQRPILSVEVH